MKLFIQSRKYGARIVTGASGLALSGLAFAQATPIDVSAATDGISAAQVAVLAVLAAMIVMAAAVYGVKKVLRLLGR